MLSENKNEVKIDDVNNPNNSNQPPLEQEHFFRGKLIDFASEKDKEKYVKFRKQFEKYGLVNLSGRTLVVKPVRKEGRDNFEFSSLKDFHEYHTPDSFSVFEDMASGQVHRHRRFSEVWQQTDELCHRYKNVVFNLDPKHQTPDEFNLWRGFIEPKAGDPTPFIEHYKKLLLDESDSGAEADYLIKLDAWVVQNPHITPGIMVLLLGGQGDGKSTVIETKRAWCPSNTTTTSNLEGFLKWNGHTANCKFIGLEEAFSNGNYLVQQRIKDIVTNPYRDIELKGKDVYQVENVVFYVGTSNSTKPFSIDEDDRRTAVFATKKAGDKAYFAKYYDWLHNQGGAAIALNYLLNLKLEGFDRADIPDTQARTALKVVSLSNEESFIYNLLCYSYDSELAITKWDSPVILDRSKLFELFKQTSNYGAELRKFSAKLAKIFNFPPNWSDNWRKPNAGGSYYKIPKMVEARQLFAAHMKSTVDSTFKS